MAKHSIAYPKYKINEEYWNCLSFRCGNTAWTCIDEEDYEFVCMRWWTAEFKVRYVRIRTTIKNNNGIKHKYLSRYIMNAFPGKHVDHINHDSLDNRRSNLRVCTLQQNCMNSAKRNGSSRYKGVSWYKPTGKWVSYISRGGKTIYLGRYESEVEAALSYNEAAKMYYGEFASLNVIE